MSKSLDCVLSFFAVHADDITELINSYCSNKADAIHVYQMVLNDIATHAGKQDFGIETIPINAFHHPGECWQAYAAVTGLLFDAFVKQIDKEEEKA